MTGNLSFFYSLEFVFSNILKRYDLEFLEEIMRQQVPFHGYINNLNLNYEKIQNCLTNKERKTFNEIYIPIDYNKLYPTNEDIPDSETGEKITIEELGGGKVVLENADKNELTLSTVKCFKNSPAYPFIFHDLAENKVVGNSQLIPWL